LVVASLLELALRWIEPRHEGVRRLLQRPASAADLETAATLEELMERTVIGFRPYGVVYGFVLNSRSLRTAEYGERPGEGVLRVLAFGDSFTFASGNVPHPDHWPTVLASRLARRLGRRVEVLRMGVPATGPAFQLRLWQLEGARLEPDIVVVGFFVGNDFTEHQQGLLGEELGGGSRAARWLAHNSLTLRAARNLLRVVAGVEQQVEGPGGGVARPERGGYELKELRDHYDPLQPSFSNAQFVRIEARRMDLCRADTADDLRQLLDGVMPVLGQFRDEVAAAGARFVVMVIPDEFQVDPGVRDAVLRREGTVAGDYDLDRPQRLLTAACRAHGIEVVDLLPRFRRRARDGTRLYRVRDTHWNPEGNHLAARILTEYLARDTRRGAVE
jgi:hypothetical protein